MFWQALLACQGPFGFASVEALSDLIWSVLQLLISPAWGDQLYLHEREIIAIILAIITFTISPRVVFPYPGFSRSNVQLIWQTREHKFYRLQKKRRRKTFADDEVEYRDLVMRGTDVGSIVQMERCFASTWIESSQVGHQLDVRVGRGEDARGRGRWQPPLLWLQRPPRGNSGCIRSGPSDFTIYIQLAQKYNWIQAIACWLGRAVFKVNIFQASVGWISMYPLTPLTMYFTLMN